MKVFALAVSLAATLAGPACIAISGADLNNYVERETKTFEISGTPDLTLTTFDGDIEIRSWDRNDVQVVIEKRGRSEHDVSTIEVGTTQNGNRVEVIVRQPKV